MVTTLQFCSWLVLKEKFLLSQSHWALMLCHHHLVSCVFTEQGWIINTHSPGQELYPAVPTHLCTGLFQASKFTYWVCRGQCCVCESPVSLYFHVFLLYKSTHLFYLCSYFHLLGSHPVRKQLAPVNQLIQLSDFWPPETHSVNANKNIHREDPICWYSLITLFILSSIEWPFYIYTGSGLVWDVAPHYFYRSPAQTYQTLAIVQLP